MPLIELLNTTKLRSLGFGHDQPHGGSSPQPYIQTQIPTKKELDRPSPDFLLRGATNADPFLSTGKDLERIGKWFFQEPAKGALFIAKQNLLSRTAAATDVSSLKLSGFLNGGIYLPTSTLFQVGVSAFGLHVNKQGLNPIPTDPGAGFLQSLLSVGSQPLYGITAYQNNYTFSNVIKTAEGKLEQLAITALSVLGLNSVGKNIVPAVDIIGGSKGVVVNLTKINNFLLKLYGGRILNATFTPNVYSYSGGPGSILGLGKTEIKFATDAGGNSIRTNPTRNIGGYLPGGAIALTQDEINSSEPYLLKSDGQIVGPNTTIGYEGKDLDFRYKLRKTLNVETDIVPHWWSIGGNYATGNRIENRTKSGDPGRVRLYDSTDLIKNYEYDKLNALKPFQTSKPQDVRNEFDVDLITFKIQVINNNASQEANDTVLYFRAFLDSISDSYTSDWDSNQYIGRSEKFYTFKSFDRSISLGWTVAAQSKAELLSMYNRLNYLASVCAGDYSSAGYMRGNLIKLTIGGYIYEQVGIMNGITFEMGEDTTWDIGDESTPQLAHVIKVTGFKFTPIHSFVPRVGKDFIHRAIPKNVHNNNLGFSDAKLDEAEFKPEEENTTTNTPADPELLKAIKYNPSDYTNLDPDELAVLQAEEKLRKEQMLKDIEEDLFNTNQDKYL
jgi:hypothetical protein